MSNPKYKAHLVKTLPSDAKAGEVYYETSSGEIVIPQTKGGQERFGGVVRVPLESFLEASSEGTAVVTGDVAESIAALFTKALETGRRDILLGYKPGDTSSTAVPISYAFTGTLSGEVWGFIVNFSFIAPASVGSSGVVLHTYFGVLANGGTGYQLVLQSLPIRLGTGSASQVLTAAGTYVNLPSVTVDSALSETSTNPVQNKVVQAKLAELEAGLRVLIPMTAMSNSTGLTSDMVNSINAALANGRPIYLYTEDSVLFPVSVQVDSSSGNIKMVWWDHNGDGRFLTREFAATGGKYAKEDSLQLELAGDGTKALTDDGTYKEFSSQQAILVSGGTVMFVINKGYQYPRSSIVNGRTPAVGDLLIYHAEGTTMVGEITLVEISYVYTSSDTTITL